MRTPNNTRRSGFTLIELLVVIAIIAVLVSLTSAAVFKVMEVADNTANRTEIGKLEVAVEAFKQKYGVEYVPSAIKLSEAGNYDMAQPLDRDSRLYLQSVFGRNLTFPVDWDGDGNISGDWVLQGDQCLVFFLGGIPHPSQLGTTGFAADPRNPAAHLSGGGGSVVQPFYEFKPHRLVRMHAGAPRFFSYLDYFGKSDNQGNRVRGQPYAFFSGYKGNNYDKYGFLDCAELGLVPYIQSVSPTRFYNANGYQIISAGQDGQFGPGGPWNPATPGAIDPRGRDDQCNFHERKLGT